MGGSGMFSEENVFLIKAHKAFGDKGFEVYPAPRIFRVKGKNPTVLKGRP